jgi:hypothetical protein
MHLGHDYLTGSSEFSSDPLPLLERDDESSSARLLLGNDELSHLGRIEPAAPEDDAFFPESTFRSQVLNRPPDDLIGDLDDLLRGAHGSALR